MYCKNCGKELSDESKFCPECGTATSIQEEEKLKAPTQSESAPISVTVAPVDVSTASVPKNMASWKIVSGILSFIIPTIILFQSCAVGMIGAFGEDTGGGGISGIIVAFFMITAGIVSIVTRKSRGGNIAIVGICGIGAILGYDTRGIYEDLVVWSSWLLLMAIMAIVCFFFWKEYVPANEENNEEANAQRAKKTKRQNIIMIITMVILFLLSPTSWLTGNKESAAEQPVSASSDIKQATDEAEMSAKQKTDGVPPESQDRLYEGEIVFQDYQWGTSVSALANEFNVPYYESVTPTLSEADDLFAASTYALGYRLDTSSQEIAGYPVLKMSMYCMYGYDNGEFSIEPENSELYLVSICFDVADVDGTYEDLREKLSGIYGDAKTCQDSGSAYSDDDGFYTYTTTKSEWRGQNDTGIILTVCTPDKDVSPFADAFNKNVVLSYGKTDVDQKRPEIYKAYTNWLAANEIESRDALNINGL